MVLPASRNDTNVQAVIMSLEVVKHVDLGLNLADYWTIRNTALSLLVDCHPLSTTQLAAAIKKVLFAQTRVYPGDKRRILIFCETLLEVCGFTIMALTIATVVTTTKS